MASASGKVTQASGHASSIKVAQNHSVNQQHSGAVRAALGVLAAVVCAAAVACVAQLLLAWGASGRLHFGRAPCQPTCSVESNAPRGTGDTWRQLSWLARPRTRSGTPTAELHSVHSVHSMAVGLAALPAHNAAARPSCDHKHDERGAVWPCTALPPADDAVAGAAICCHEMTPASSPARAYIPCVYACLIDTEAVAGMGLDAHYIEAQFDIDMHLTINQPPQSIYSA